MKHPLLETLIGYSESPAKDEYAAVRRHLLVCGQCRQSVQRLNGLKRAVQHLPESINDTDYDHSVEYEEKIAKYVDKQLDDVEREDVKKKLYGDPKAMKSALHYAAHSHAMKSALSEKPKKADSTKSELVSKLASVLLWHREISLPVPLALAASFMLCVAIVSQLYVDNETSALLAPYQDNPVITFQDKALPSDSIGFFSQSIERSQPYHGVEMRLDSEDTLRVTWPPVDQATGYRFELHRVGNGGLEPVASVTTIETIVELSAIQLAKGYRYEWRLSGETTQYSFHTIGGFVVYD